jgi:poly-gamma-glutamate synthesis protein (capsule biosynthesis protein)
MGADLVVCHHPHVPMNYELVGDKAIFYSLGNFIFDTDYQRAQYNTDIGVLLKLNFTETEFSFEPMGIRIVRGEERIEKGELPRIFTNVTADEYEKLSPLAAKMFIAATKRQQIYLNPKEFENATDEKWAEHFANPRRSGRVEGEALDFFIVCPLAEKETEKAWKTSQLEDVKAYILEQM